MEERGVSEAQARGLWKWRLSQVRSVLRVLLGFGGNFEVAGEDGGEASGSERSIQVSATLGWEPGELKLVIWGSRRPGLRTGSRIEDKGVATGDATGAAKVSRGVRRGSCSPLPSNGAHAWKPK